MWKLWKSRSLEALRKALTSMRGMKGGKELKFVENVKLSAKAMLVNLAADVIRIESHRTVGW